jgi:hypothetical protein
MLILKSGYFMGLKAKSFDIKLKARGKKWLDNLPSVL